MWRSKKPLVLAVCCIILLMTSASGGIGAVKTQADSRDPLDKQLFKILVETREQKGTDITPPENNRKDIKEEKEAPAAKKEVKPVQKEVKKTEPPMKIIPAKEQPADQKKPVELEKKIADAKDSKDSKNVKDSKDSKNQNDDNDTHEDESKDDDEEEENGDEENPNGNKRANPSGKREFKPVRSNDRDKEKRKRGGFQYLREIFATSNAGSTIPALKCTISAMMLASFAIFI